ncbi:hypothetical protein FRC19_010620, partial [Serendipita sp. 401]
MPPKKKGKSGVPSTEDYTVGTSIRPGSGPIALCTRASSKSPHKRPTAASLRQSRAVANLRKGWQSPRGPDPFQGAPQSLPTMAHPPQSDHPSPADQPRRVGVVRVIPDGVFAYSQRRSESDVDVDEMGNVIDGPSMLDVSLDVRKQDAVQDNNWDEGNEGDELLDEEYEEREQRRAVDFPWAGDEGDAELFQDNDEGSIIDITPVIRAARILEMAGIPVDSPLANFSTRNVAPAPEEQDDHASEAQVTAVVDSAFDILEQHRTKRKRAPPLSSMLDQSAARVDPVAPRAPQSRSFRMRASTSRPPARPFTQPHQPEDLSLPHNIGDMPRPNNSNVRPHPTVAELARYPPQEELGEEVDIDISGPNELQRRRSGNPAPHQMLWHTPHSREFHRWAKVDYSFKIATENAYPSAQERLLMARAAYDSAWSALPELADSSSGVQWSIEKMRLYTDTAWVRRGVIKACASSMVFGAYRLALTPAIAAQMPGGVTQANQAAFTSERVSYLFTDGHWLRGRLNGVYVKTTSMLYAHSIFGDVIEETIYRLATAPQRAKLCPMPIPTVALVATAVQCALEEYASGYRKRIPFTEESYRRVYSVHLKRLNRAMTTHRHHMTELLQTLYEHCVARNEPLANQNPREEEEFDDLDVLLSDHDGDSCGEDDELGFE